MFNAKTGDVHGSETIIGSSVKVEGKFHGTGNVTIEGRVVGSMKTDGDVIITQSADIQANVDARNVTIAGTVTGNVKAHERLEIAESAKVFGDVEAKIVSVGAGAVLNGKCTVTNESPSVADQSVAKSGKTRQAEAV